LSEPSASDVGTSELALQPQLNWHRIYEPVQAPVAYPIVAPVPAAYNVRRVIVQEGTTERLVAFSYRYGSYRADALSKKSLGFAWRESINEADNMMTHVDVSQDVKSTGKLLHEE